MREKKLSKLNDAIKRLYFRNSKQVNLENALERIEAKQDASHNALVAADTKLNNLLSSPNLTQPAGTSIVDAQLVDKFVTILTHFHSNNEVRKGLDTPDYIWKQLNNFRVLAQIYGQLSSMDHKASIDGNGRPIPWYTYPAIEYLSNLDFSQKRVFEYGSGNSSLWWATRCREIVAIECNREWYDKINAVRSHVGGGFGDYRLCEETEAYVHQHDIVDSNIVIIDGMYRTYCTDFFLSKLSESNSFEILIYDNSDWQPDVIKNLNQQLCEWVQVDFHGFGPINDYTWTTTIFLNGKVKQKYAKNISSLNATPYLRRDDE
jgi:hypothetical protein